MNNVAIKVTDEGFIEFVYDDELVGLLDLGEATVVRASHVEPRAGWTADMSPSGGPVLGPFRLRSEALQAERDWLAEHCGL